MNLNISNRMLFLKYIMNLNPSDKKFLFACISITLLLLNTSCGDNKKGNANQSSDNTINTYQQKSPSFQADSAFKFIEKQLQFGPRVSGTEANTKCGDWMVSEFRKYTNEVIEQKANVNIFNHRKLPIRNIIASFNPEASQRVIICTHWDSRPYADNDPDPANHDKAVPAADDGASGVGILLEIARQLQANPISIGVDLICFDAEDLGKSEFEDSYCYGSQYWSLHPHKPGYKADYGILLDMTGAANARFVWEAVSIDFAAPILQKVWDKANQLGYSNMFYYYRKGGITDDHYYMNTLAKIPTIDIIHYSEQTRTGFPPHWHTVSDDLKVIDKTTLKQVGQTMLEVLYTEQKK